MRRALPLSCVLLLACGDTGGGRVALPLYAEGTLPRVVALGDAQLTLERAELAFGPAYFCASEQGRAELCEVALAELTEVTPVRALDPSPQPLGTLRGTEGDVRSAVFDYGITWLLTQSAPMASPRAPEQHSAVLEGSVTRGAELLRFRVAVDVVPRGRGDAAVHAQRTYHDIQGSGDRLTVLVDPHRWVDRLDPAALFALDGDRDGRVELAPGSPAYESVLQGMVNRAPVTFRWDGPAVVP